MLSPIPVLRTKRTFLPIFSAAAVAACSPAEPEIAEIDGETVECALAGAAEFAPDCRLTQVAATAGPVWVMRHPDGGFRRLVLADTASGYDVLDGAEQAVSETTGGVTVMTIGGDRYRWREAR